MSGNTIPPQDPSRDTHDTIPSMPSMDIDMSQFDALDAPSLGGYLDGTEVRSDIVKTRPRVSDVLENGPRPLAPERNREPEQVKKDVEQYFKEHTDVVADISSMMRGEIHGLQLRDKWNKVLVYELKNALTDYYFRRPPKNPPRNLEMMTQIINKEIKPEFGPALHIKSEDIMQYILSRMYTEELPPDIG